MDFSFCGMAVDVLRSCYRSRMRFDRTRPDLTVEVEWFFCPPGAKLNPYPTAFGSRNYTEAREEADLSLGEVEITRRWVRGNCPPGVIGQFFCGDPSHAANGCDLVNGPLELLDVDGVPLCCRGGISVDDDVRDINFWRQSGANPPLSWYLGGGPFKVPYDPSISISQDTDYIVPYFPARGDTVDQLGVFITTPGFAANTVRLAIYEAVSETDLRPGPLVAETGDLNATLAAGMLADTVSFPFDRLKLYWLALNVSDNTGLQLGGVLDGSAQGIFGTNPMVLQGRNGITRARAYGPFPDPYPALVDADIANVCPCLAFVIYE